MQTEVSISRLSVPSSEGIDHGIKTKHVGQVEAREEWLRKSFLRKKKLSFEHKSI